MRIWLDTEFVDEGYGMDANTDLISIGLVREDGAELYLENAGALVREDLTWMYQNVMPKLGPANQRLWLPEIRDQVIEFCGEPLTPANRLTYSQPQFWAYYASFDWFLFCKLFGGMIHLPKGWSRFCRDVRQYTMHLGIDEDRQGAPVQAEHTKHHALADAKWLKEFHLWFEQRHYLLAERKPELGTENDG